MKTPCLVITFGITLIVIGVGQSVDNARRHRPDKKNLSQRTTQAHYIADLCGKETTLSINPDTEEYHITIEYTDPIPQEDRVIGMISPSGPGEPGAQTILAAYKASMGR